MSVEPIKRGRQEAARVTCDECGQTIEVAARHDDNQNMRRGGKIITPIASQKSVNQKIERQGWELVKGKHLCPACSQARKEPDRQEEEPMSQIKEQLEKVDLRRPTPKQKREIMGMLEVAYDDDAKRYKGDDTDKSVAEAIGNGVLPGWVAEIREEFFGPDGSNEGMEKVRDEIEALLSETKVLWQDIQNARAAFDAKIQPAFDKILSNKEQIKKLGERIEGIRRAVGPKAGCK